MKILAIVIAIATLAGCSTASAGHNPQPSDTLADHVRVQLNEFFPDCADMDWRIRTYARRQSEWQFIVYPKDAACIGYRKFLAYVDGVDLISLQVEERVELPYSGRVRNVWLPLANIAPYPE